MTRKLKIVFIGHDSTLTGAPILLLNLLEILIKTNKYDITLVLVRGGSLEEKFRSVVPVYLLKPGSYSQESSIFGRVINYLTFRRRIMGLKEIVNDADLIVSNTVANGRLLKYLKGLHIPVFTYIHELESVIKYFEKNNDSPLTMENSDWFICPSNAVAANLITNHKIPEHRIEYLPYFIKSVARASIEELQNYRQRLFSKNNIPENRFYVAGMGTATSRKGIDLFLEVCKATVKQCPDICFVWIGGFEDEAMSHFIESQVAENNLQPYFFVTGRQEHCEYGLSPFDIFFLSSREDPYPLVVLEAAQLEIPSLYFENTGGIGEFIGTEAGWPIEKFNIEKASDEIIRLRHNSDEVRRKGKYAFEKVTRIHTDEKAIASNFGKIVETNLDKKAR